MGVGSTCIEPVVTVASCLLNGVRWGCVVVVVGRLNIVVGEAWHTVVSENGVTFRTRFSFLFTNRPTRVVSTVRR
jgi:hypothetical protein